MNHYQIRETDAATNHHPVDDMEPEQDTRGDLAEALTHIVLWIHTSKEAELIGARALVLATALNLDVDTNTSYSNIGRVCGCSREAVRLMAKELETRFGLRSHFSRSDKTRRRCKAARERVLGA